MPAPDSGGLPGAASIAAGTTRKFKPSSAARGRRIGSGGGGAPGPDGQKGKLGATGQPGVLETGEGCHGGGNNDDPWLAPDLAPRPAKRVLICAQSNAAVDELVLGDV